MESSDTKIEDLPEDVVCRIFSCLDMRDVARASASCSALLRAWATHPYLRFDAETLRLRRGDDDGQTEEHASAFVRLVDAILLSPRRRSSPAPLEELTVSFADLRERHGPCVDGWVRFATTKRLTLDLLPDGHGCCYSPDRLYYAFPCSLLQPALEHLFLRQGSLAVPVPPAPATTTTTNSSNQQLATLVLAYVRVTGDDLERFLSSCHRLRSLELKRCDLLDYVNVGTKRQLTSLAVEYCWSMTSMDVSGSAIQSLRLAGQNLPPSLLQQERNKQKAPQLLLRPALKVTSASFDLNFYFDPPAPPSSNTDTNKTKKKKKRRRLELLRLAQALPCLESLELRNIRHREIRVAPAGRFHHLRRADISLNTPDEYDRPSRRRSCWKDLLFIYSFLDAAPALEALTLRLARFAPTYTDPQRPAATCRPIGVGARHRCLRFVDITGFDADVASLDLVLYILEKAATALRSLSLEPTWVDSDHFLVRIMAEDIELIRQVIARHIAPELPSGSGILLQVK